MQSTIVDNVEKLLEQPIMRIVAATGLLLVAFNGVVGLILSVVDLLGVFESLFFNRLWNLAQGEWLAIVIVAGAWVALGSMIKLDTAFLGTVAGAFLFLAGVMGVVRRELPDILRDLYGLVPSTLFLVAVVVGLVTVLKANAAGGDFEIAGLFGKASSNLGLGGGAPAPMGMPSQAPPPGAAPAPVPAPVSPQEAGWLPDPQGEAKLRYWDGSAWTEHTHNG